MSQNEPEGHALLESRRSSSSEAFSEHELEEISTSLSGVHSFKHNDKFSNRSWLQTWSNHLRHTATLWPKRRVGTVRRRTFNMSSYCMLALIFLLLLLFFFLLVALIHVVFWPSYSNLPQHYQDLRTKTEASDEPGRGNVHGEIIYIASSRHGGEGLVPGDSWSRSILQLIDILGPENVFLSIYGDDPDPMTKIALDEFVGKVKCERKSLQLLVRSHD